MNVTRQSVISNRRREFKRQRRHEGAEMQNINMNDKRKGWTDAERKHYRRFLGWVFLSTGIGVGVFLLGTGAINFMRLLAH